MLPSAIFDTRNEKQTISAITVQAVLPANMPVLLTLAHSADLANWSEVPLRGRLYRFEGADAPVNHRLELEQPLRLEGRYLRLSWPGQAGVQITTISGLVTVAIPAPERLRVALPAPRLGQPGQGGQTLSSLEWATGFATPIAALALATSQTNTLVPVRILGRNDTSQPWRLLAQGVLYRLGEGANAVVNPPVPLAAPSVRWLRVETQLPLDTAQISAAAEFDPLHIVFVASGAPPFELAAGRPATASTALPLATLIGAQATQPEDLPQARVAAILADGAREPHPLHPLHRLQALLPSGVAPKTAALWAVLVLGVAVLAGVALSLLRQMRVGQAR